MVSVGASCIRVILMLYRLLADLIVLLHFGFVLFAVLGGFLVWWRRWIAWLHVPALLWAATIEFTGGICPLTPLENWFRQRGNEAGYSGGFIEQYVIAILYPGGLTRNIQLVLGTAVLVINLFIYGWVLVRARRSH